MRNSNRITVRRTVTLTIAALFLIAILAGSPSMLANAASSWNVQTVDEYAWAGGYCPIAVDSNGTAHMAYMDFPSGTNLLTYASYNGSRWVNQTAVSGYVHDVFSLVLDKNGNPHILFNPNPLGSPINPLKIAVWNGRSWDIQGTGITYAGYATLALDSSGNPHIAYTTGVELQYGSNWVGSALKYASWTGTGWNIQTLDSTMNDSFSTVSLALDSNSTPYILYGYSSNPSSIKLATVQNSSWKTQTVPLSPSTGNCGNIVVDSKGYPHFICTQPNQNTTDLVYAGFDGTSWNTTVADSKVNWSHDGSMGQLVLDSKDYPHFCYVESDGNLMYAAYSGRAWNIQTVESNVYPLGQCYLALDANGNPHMSYRTSSPMRFTANLKYATTTDSTKSSSPTSPVALDLPLLTVTGVIIIVAAAAIAFSVKISRRARKATS